MHISYSVHIDAPPAKVWDAVVDVERWPEFAGQFKRIERKESGPLAMGSSARVTPHGFFGATWTVSRFEPQRSFLWEANMLPGLHLAADHVVEGEAGGTKVTLSLESSGPSAAVMNLALGRIFRNNVRLEGDGLKAHCERNAS
jgi:uncharacterized protein YndB with AHSA1/START domain